MEICVISRNDLEYMIHSAVQNALENFAQNVPITKNDAKFLKIKDAAELTGFGVATLYAFSRNGKLKRHYFGKKLVFDRDDLLALANEWVKHS